MTKREMMVKAHGLASKMVGNYSVRLSLALRQLWALLKKGVAGVKELVVGKDYYDIFGSDTTGSKKFIFNGGISWTAIMPGKNPMTMDSQAQTDKAIAYINQPSYGTGIRA